MIRNAINRGVHSVYFADGMMQGISTHQISRDQQGSVDVKEIGISVHPAEAIQWDYLILRSRHRKYRRVILTDHHALNFARTTSCFVAVHHYSAQPHIAGRSFK